MVGSGRLSKKPRLGTNSGANSPANGLSGGSKSGSIQSFFAAQSNKQEKKVPCPICSVEVIYRSINAHLDECSGGGEIAPTAHVDKCNNGADKETAPISYDDELVEQKTTLSTTMEKVEVTKSHSTIIKKQTSLQNFSEITSSSQTVTSVLHTETTVENEKEECIAENDLKRKVSLDENVLENPKKAKVAANEDEFSDDSEYENDLVNLALDTQIVTQALKTPRKSELMQQPSSQSSSQERILLSPSISYNPAKYGGMKALGSQSGTDLVRTSSKRASDKYSPRRSAAARRNQAREKLPNMPQHDPYTPSKRIDPEYVPYYVTNFEYILTCVIECTDDWQLFNEDELKIIDSYRELPLSARKLYVRLFNRKHAWILDSAIKYNECPDIPGSANILVSAKLLQDKEDLSEIEDCLNILHTPEVKILAKEFNVQSKGTSKQDIVQELKRMCEKKSIFQTKSTLKEKVLKRGRSLVGPCYRLQPESRSVLNRVVCLWGISLWWSEREDDRPPNSLTTLLLANQGKLVFPQYHIMRERNIFRNREDLIECDAGMKLVDKLEAALAAKEFQAGHAIFLDIKKAFQRIIQDVDLMDYVKSLPVFLRKLTVPAVYVFGLSRSVDLLEKMKDYSGAVELLKLLLKTDFIFKYRGVWYERLCLDLESHLKLAAQSLQWIKTALDDKRVRGARRLALHHRVTKICKAKKNQAELGDKLLEFTGRPDWQEPTPDDLPTVVISGKMVSKEGVSNTKSVFILTKDGETTYCNVEELVRDYYKDQGLHEGCHAEGALLNSLLTLLFWDIIYLSATPDAFRDPAQSAPLDWDTDDFYASRKDIIDERLKEISAMSKDELSAEVENYFVNNLNVSSMVSWDLLKEPEYIAGLLGCFEPSQLALILERMIKDHRTYRSGLPDLTCWNPTTQQLKFVEVKGPGDKLSYKQILWIRFFMSIGVTAEVCHVDPTGSVHSTRMKVKNARTTPRKSAQNAPKNGAKNKATGGNKESQKGKGGQDTKNSDKKGKRNTKKGKSNGDDDDFEI